MRQLPSCLTWVMSMPRLKPLPLVMLVAAFISAGCTPMGLGNSRAAAPEGRWDVQRHTTFVRVPEVAPTRPARDVTLIHPHTGEFVNVNSALRAVSSRSTRATQPLQKSLWAPQRPPLSPGDRLQVNVTDGDEFSGIFDLDLDGTLNLPYLPGLQAAGNSSAWVQDKIARALVTAGYFRNGLVQVSVKVQQWSPVQVNVSGAVFQPGLVTINVRKPEEKAQKSLQRTGDFPTDRLMPAALRAAGGVRPDADVTSILLVRNGIAQEVNLSGVFFGAHSDALPMMAGDRLIVPSTGQYDETLVRPTAITPPGIRIFISNLTIPATDNSKSAVSGEATKIPYGTRLLTALISGNCVGGTNMTNSGRYGVLVTHNPLSGQSEVIERPIEDLLRRPEDTQLNPLMMPNDGIACYDSGVSNVRDIARTLADIVLPFRIRY